MNKIPKVRIGGKGRRVNNSCNGGKNGSGCHVDRLPFAGGRTHQGKPRRAKLQLDIVIG